MSERAPIRVLRVVESLNLGGPAHQATLLSGRRLAAKGFGTLLVHGCLADGEESMADRVAAEDVNEMVLDSLVQPVNPRHDTRALQDLIRVVRDFEPDIVHTHTAKAGFIGRAAAIAASRGRKAVQRPALVHTYHGHVLEGYFGPLRAATYRQLERSLGKRSDALIGVSQATVDDLVRLGVAERERFHVVPLGLDLVNFAVPGLGASERARVELGIRGSEVLVSYVGRFVAIKRLDVLLRAIAVARGTGAPVRAVLAGDGESRADLEALARELGIAEHVHFLGYRRDLSDLAAAADIAAISSANEGTPVSLIEAAAAGVPAVATRVGGVGEVVLEDETGLLVKSGDAAALGAAIARLAGDSELRERMGDKARMHALARYSIDRLVGDICSLYEDLAGRRVNSV